MLDFGGVPIASIRLVYFPTFTIKNQPFMILTWILRDMIFLRDVCWFVQSVHPWKLIYPLKIDGWKMKLPFYSGFFSGDIRSFCGVGGGGGGILRDPFLLRCSHKKVQRGIIVQRRGFWASIYHRAAPTQSVHRHWSRGCTKSRPNGIAWETSLRIQTPPGSNRMECRGNPVLRTYLDS